MSGKKVLIFSVLFLLFLWIAPKQEQNSQLTHKVAFLDTESFNKGINKTKNLPFDHQVNGGIVPHDLFASFIIADFFKRLSFQNPKTIILLGPNHFEKGNFLALTSLYGWETPFGIVRPDNSSINTLMSRNLVRIDEDTLPHDHAVSAIMPFIKFYLPQAKVVPILLSGKMTQNESELLADGLSSILTKETVLVASVDFSHYLLSKEAQKKDETTIQAIKNFNYKQLYLFNNDYLDSPPSIGTLLGAMQKLKTTGSEVLYHTNSGDLQKNEFIQTTSYFSLAYY